MVDQGYYVVEFYYKDKRGHILTGRKTRGRFELMIDTYKDLIGLMGTSDRKAPLEKPRLVQIVDGMEVEIDFDKELKEWQRLNSKNN